jgi:hypothetical protein
MAEHGRMNGDLDDNRHGASMPLPGHPHQAQEPQEPRSIHARGGDDQHERAHGHSLDQATERDDDRGVVDQLKDVWDRMRGK